MSIDSIPVMKPRLPTYERYAPYLRLIDESQTYTNRGPLVRLLETRYAERLCISDSSRVVLCSNATLAIQGFLQISDAKTWHVPSFTFAATVHAAIQSGKEVVLEDIDPETWMISPNVITDSKTNGVIPVLPFGAPFEPSAFKHINHLLVDAAASIGGAANWINDLRESWAAVFSLHATKSFGIGEGGLIVFGSKDLANEFRAWINFGFSGSRESLRLGTNAKLSEVQAAVGLAVLDNWEAEEKEWLASRALVNQVNNSLGLEPTLALLRGDELVGPYWIIFHHEPAVVNQIERHLLDHAIATRKWWSPVAHKMPGFRHLENHILRETDFISARYLGLPFFRKLATNELSKIVILLEEVLNRHE